MHTWHKPTIVSSPSLPKHDLLSFKCFNARSIKNKLHELGILSSANLNFIAITETWLNDDFPNSAISAHLENYSIYKSDRVDGRGGALILTSPLLHVESLPNVNVTNIESVWCKLINYNNVTEFPLITACVYRSPSCSFSDLESRLNIVQLSFFSTRLPPKLIIVGDFNLPNYDWNIPSSTIPEQNPVIFLNFLNDYGLVQLNLQPTRESNILDLLITNTPDRIADLTTDVHFSTSHHDSLLFSVTIFRPSHVSNLFIQSDMNISLDFAKADFPAIKSDLGLVNNWYSVLKLDDSNNMWDTFCHILHNIFLNHCPTRKVTLVTSHERLPTYIMNLIHAKHRARRYYKQC